MEIPGTKCFIPKRFELGTTLSLPNRSINGTESNCAVPENIHTPPPTEETFISVVSHPHPLEISLALRGVCGYFLELHIAEMKTM